MSWRRAAGVVSVVLVIGAAIGSVAALAVGSDTLLTSAVVGPAIATLIVVAIGLLVTILAANPSRDWVGNPYW